MTMIPTRSPSAQIIFACCGHFVWEQIRSTVMDRDEIDIALADAIWQADNMGFGTPKPLDDFADVYIALAQEIRVWLRKNGFDVTRLPNEFYEDYERPG